MTAIYPGSFDPPTKGHLDIIRRAAALFDEVVVLTMVNEKKTPFLSAQERLELLEDITHDLPNVRAGKSSRLLVEEIERYGAGAVVRGIRSVNDFTAEQPVADIFMQLHGTETVFLQSQPDNSFISSSVVREILHFGGDVSPFLPEAIAEKVAEYGKRLQN